MHFMLDIASDVGVSLSVSQAQIYQKKSIFPSSPFKLYEKSDIDDWILLCVHVLRLSWLQVLELDNCPLITDVSLDHLVGCHNLQRIEL